MENTRSTRSPRIGRSGWLSPAALLGALVLALAVATGCAPTVAPGTTSGGCVANGRLIGYTVDYIDPDGVYVTRITVRNLAPGMAASVKLPTVPVPVTYLWNGNLGPDMTRNVSNGRLTGNPVIEVTPYGAPNDVYARCVIPLRPFSSGLV